MNSTQFLIAAWQWRPAILIMTALTLAVYFKYFGWTPKAAWLLSAAALFLLTVCSPLAALANAYLFSAHMLQHLLLVLVIPAFALLALPRHFHFLHSASRLSHPAVSWACGVGAMWIWHAPALCNAAATSGAVWAVQTVSLLLLGAIFWWQLLAPDPAQRIPPLHGVLYLFTACTACTVLGIILTFSPVTVCSAYQQPADPLGIAPLIRDDWGMTPSRDQQIGGLIMWVPMCMVYLGAIFGQLARWYSVPAEPRVATT